MSYVDGFVAAVPRDNQAAYRRHCEAAAAIFKEYGALRVVECWGDDVPAGQVTDFATAVKATSDEVVVFSWIEWPSKDARNAGWDKAMADPRMRPDADPMPFDGKRMIHGGFAPMLDV